MQQLALTATDGALISCYELWPVRPRAVLQIVHGLSEHAARYRRLAETLHAQRVAVVTHDHRGHGPAAADQLGHFGEGGWDQVIADVGRVNEHSRERNDQLPVFLFGHSMGSFVAQAAVGRGALHCTGLLLSGSSLGRSLELRAGQLLAGFECWRQGPRGFSRVLDRMAFGDFARRFEPRRTDFDWLSRDAREVDRYIADPLCGQAVNNALWRSLFGGLREISAPRFFARFPIELPLWIGGGSVDPVGGQRGLERLADAYRRAGCEDLTLKLYAGARHEILNETNRAEVISDLLTWLDGRLERRG